MKSKLREELAQQKAYIDAAIKRVDAIENFLSLCEKYPDLEACVAELEGQYSSCDSGVAGMQAQQMRAQQQKLEGES